MTSGRGERIRTSGLCAPNNEYGYQKTVPMWLVAYFSKQYYTTYKLKSKEVRCADMVGSRQSRVAQLHCQDIPD